MRSIALALSLFALPLSAANIWFDPPNPTSRTSVVAHVTVPYNGCPPSGATATRNANIISITVRYDCAPGTPTPVTVDQPVDLGIVPAGVYDVVASPNNLLVGIAEATLTVQDGSSPLDIEPNVSALDGDLILIKGPGIAPVCAVAPCPTPIVLFGKNQAEIVQQIDTNTILVRAPQHDVGTVDVTVSSAGQVFRSTAGFHYFSPGSTPDLAFFEPVLFPVMLSGPGAFGSSWLTEATMRNENDVPLTTAAPNVFEIHGCEPLCDPRIPAHATSANAGNLPNGFMMFVPRQASRKLFFGLLVHDLSKQAEALGTEIPVVREDDFYDRQFTLLNVPSDPRFRVSLRLYRIDGGSSLRIRIRQLRSEAAPLVDTDIPLTTAANGAYTIGYVGDLLGTYPQLVNKQSLRIEIDGESLQRATWGFVSVTNNNTQHVTVISPQ